MINKEEQILIISERIETFKDFTINLIYYIKHYYLDKECLNNEKDMYNHYNFCFNKVCDEFLKEDMNFKENEQLKKYFWDYFSNQFYKSDNSINISLHIKIWEDIFDLKKHINKNNLAVLIELYEIFDESLEKKINKKTCITHI